MSERAPRVLAITPCHNDGWAIPELSDSLVAQRLPVTDWIVVDDASTDGTPAILDALADRVPFLTVHRRDRPAGRRIGEKAHAVMAGYRTMTTAASYDFVSVLDADVVLPADYFGQVVAAMDADPNLGVTGGVYREHGAASGRAAGHHVPGPAQVFRAEVFAAVGGYSPLPFGGDDVESVTRARLLGWTTHALPDASYSHRRRMGTGGHGSPLRADLNLGRQDHDLGTWPPFELVKIARHLTRRPLVAASVARAIGYVEMTLRRRPRSVDDDYVRFVRREQRERLIHAVTGLLGDGSRRRSAATSGADRTA